MIEAHDEAARESWGRLVAIMHALRQGCPWDAEQTHASLLPYLTEEACEVIDAVEQGGEADLCEELGDLLFQVVFHAELAAERGAFTIADVATGIADKLVRRHPHVFSGDDVPGDLNATWEANKRAEKQRTSALEGIPTQLSALARAAKVASRTRAHGVDVELAAERIDDVELGERLVELAFRAEASGLDPEAAARAALRRAEERIHTAE